MNRVGVKKMLVSPLGPGRVGKYMGSAQGRQTWQGPHRQCAPEGERGWGGMQEPPVRARRGEPQRTVLGVCAHSHVTMCACGCTAARVDFSRGGSKGQLALGVTMPRPLGPCQLGQSGQASAQGSVYGARYHKGPSESIKAPLCPRPPPHPSLQPASPVSLAGGAEVRHKNEQVHSPSCSCPCWLPTPTWPGDAL